MSSAKRRRMNNSSRNCHSRNRARRLGSLEALETRRLMAFTTPFEIGSPFSNEVEVATDSTENGMAVAVWTKRDANGDTDIQAQLYDPQGSEIGDVINVSNTSRQVCFASPSTLTRIAAIRPGPMPELNTR